MRSAIPVDLDQSKIMLSGNGLKTFFFFFWGGGKLEEIIVGKGENAGFQYFLLFSQCFQKVSFAGSLKVGIVW